MGRSSVIPFEAPGNGHTKRKTFIEEVMVEEDDYGKDRGIKQFFRRILTNKWFHVVYMVLVILDIIAVYCELFFEIEALSLNTCDCPEHDEIEPHGYHTVIQKILSYAEISAKSTTHTPDHTTVSTTTETTNDHWADLDVCEREETLEHLLMIVEIISLSFLIIFCVEIIMKFLFVSSLFRHRTEILDAVIVIVALVLTVVNIFEEREGIVSEFTFIFLFTLRVIRMINGVALVMVNNYKKKIGKIELKLRQEEERTTILLLLHSYEEQTRNQQVATKVKPVKKMTFIDEVIDQAIIEDISDESFDQMRARITAGGRFLDSPVNKKPLIERKQDLQLEKMLLLRNQWLREVEDSIMKDGNHAFDLLRSHAVATPFGGIAGKSAMKKPQNNQISPDQTDGYNA